uniref:MazG-like domain protein n=1 Tax=Siphoviridae sp. ctJT77 TaxID=2825432 RepID=A0A8S5UZJ9_9CAUD|nr:MAG TPA: MazG-like domain protein [Siphoviridae sp. ctJT77]
MKELKEGDYYINLANQSLRSAINNEDFTDMIGDFSKFFYLGVDVNGDTIRLINSPIKGFIFVRYPSIDGKFIRANEILKIKEEEKMDKEKIKVTSAEIIVTGDPKNPYYEIKYLAVGNDEYTIGYGSYDLKIVTKWYNDCFEFVTGELKPEERIRKLEEEKAELQLQIKNQAKYDKTKKVGDELALHMKALQDSGFSRDEAMQIFMMASMNAMIPPFLGR